MRCRGAHAERVQLIHLLILLFAGVGLLTTTVPGFDHPFDDGHDHRADPDDEPDDEDPPDEPEDPCDSTGSPVYLSNGNLLLSFVDLPVHGDLPLDVRRTYNSRDDRNGLAGKGWMHAFEVRCIPVTDGPTRAVLIRWPNGQRHRFTRQPNGSFSEPLGCPVKLEELPGGGYRVSRGRLYIYEFDADGQPTRLMDTNGNEATFDFDVAGCISGLTLPSGQITVSRGANGKIGSITGPGGGTVTYTYDGDGNLIEVLDPVGETTTFVYDSLDRLTQVINGLGQTTTAITYDVEGRVSTLVDSEGDFTYSYLTNETRKTNNVDGGVWIYTLDSEGVVTQVTDPEGNTTSNTYDALYRLTDETDANGNTTSYQYDANNNIVLTTDPFGNTESRTYTNDNLLETVTDQNGIVTKFEYDGNGNVTKRIQAFGTPEERMETFGYDAAGNVTTHTNFDGKTTTFTYDAMGNVLTRTDPENNTTTNTYDAAGNLLSTSDQAGNTTMFQYDLLGRPTVMSDDVGMIEAFAYDAAGNLASITDGNGDVVSFEYDIAGRVTLLTDGLGETQEWTYGAHGATEFENALGNRTLTTYDLAGRVSSQVVELAGGPDMTTMFQRDGNGNPTAVTDSNGNSLTNTFDKRNRLTSTTLLTGDAITYEYDDVGKLTRRKRGNGFTEEFLYDEASRIVQISDSVGTKMSFTYGDGDQPLTESDAANNTTTFVYDDAGRMLERSYPDGTKEKFAYGPDMQLSSVTDRSGSAVTFTRDARGRIVSSTTLTGETISAVYDLNDRITSLTDANNNVTMFEYDAEGRETKRTFPDSSMELRGYDADGRLTSRTKRDGVVIGFEYDERGLLTKQDFPGPNDDVFTYGLAGEMLTATNATSTISFAYDAAGRVTSETNNGKVTQYSYDTAAMTRTYTYPGGRQVTEGFDVRERMTSVVDASAGTLATIAYDGTDATTSRVYGNGTQTTFLYNLTGLATEVRHSRGATDLVHLQYDYSPNGRAIRERNLTAPTMSRRYVLDADDRLMSYRRGPLVGDEIPVPNRSIDYQLDLVGNWQSVVRDGVAEARTVNNLNEYTAVDSVTYLHDANGNLTQDDDHLYEYDAFDRLVRVERLSDSMQLAAFTYDALGRRSSATDSGGTTTEFFYNNRLNVIEERVANATTATYAYGPGLDDVIGMTRGGSDYTYHRNLTGSVVALTDSAGNVVEQYEYDPYGSVEFMDGAGMPLAGSAVGNPYLFTGRRYDAETGLYFYRTRYLHPELGRFLSIDPAGFIDGVNLREYATGDPVNQVDPLGLESKSCNVATSVAFDASGRVQRITGEFLKAFGIQFKVGGSIAFETKFCEQKCCEEGDTYRTVTWREYSLEGEVSMSYSSKTPIIGWHVPLIGGIGLYGSLSFKISASGSTEGTLTATCEVRYSGEACAQFTGTVSLFVGGKLDENKDSDPFEGKLGITGKGSLSGKICYSTEKSWYGQACISGSITLEVEIKIFWVSFGGSYTIAEGKFCSN